MVGACKHVSFKVLVLCLDSCKGLSRGGKSGEGVPPPVGGGWRRAKFWERFDGSNRSGSMPDGSSLWDWTVQGAGCSFGRFL